MITIGFLFLAAIASVGWMTFIGWIIWSVAKWGVA
jgi:hypothetical protein